MLDSFPDYELLDFGDGRKFERFGERTLIRPHPSADQIPVRSAAWNASAEFQLTDRRSSHQRGRWIPAEISKTPWTIPVGPLTLQLKLTPFGHVGLFPEHFAHWQWIMSNGETFRDRKILNLFAYTGAQSLLLAHAGARVTHVDASSAAVRWARRNSELSGLDQAPVRWIVEDATRFVRREIKRGAKYDGIILDPPSFGRGPNNESWKIDRDLGELLSLLREVCGKAMSVFIVSAHSPGVDARYLRRVVREVFGDLFDQQLDAAELFQQDPAGRQLACGSYVRSRG